MDDERRWEELNVDCLINIFKRVGIESLLMDVPFVCKPWHQASLKPSCWESLIFPELYYPLIPLYHIEDWYPYTCFDRFKNEYKFDGIHVSVTAFVKFVIDRSKGRTTCLELSCLSSSDLEDALKYATDQCPDLKALSLIFDEDESMGIIIWKLIGNWKHLESLVLKGGYEMKIFLAADCKSLRVLHVEDASIGKQEAEAIVTFWPELKELILRRGHINRDEIVTLLQGCKELVHLDVSACDGFDGEDEEIAKLASHIANFSSQGSTIYEDDDYDNFGLSSRVDFGYGSD